MQYPQHVGWCCKHAPTRRPLSRRRTLPLSFHVPLFDDYIELPDAPSRAVEVAMMVGWQHIAYLTEATLSYTSFG